MLLLLLLVLLLLRRSGVDAYLDTCAAGLVLLDKTDWSRLHHAYGRANDTPATSVLASEMTSVLGTKR